MGGWFKTTTAINESYVHIIEALSHVHDDYIEKDDTKHHAQVKIAWAVSWSE